MEELRVNTQTFFGPGQEGDSFIEEPSKVRSYVIFTTKIK